MGRSWFDFGKRNPLGVEPNKMYNFSTLDSEFIRRNITCLGDFKLFGDKKILEDFFKAWGGVRPLFFCQMFLANQLCTSESPLLYFIGGGMPCHQ